MFLSYSICHLIGFLLLSFCPIDLVWRQAIMGGVWALRVVKLYPFADPGLGFRAAAPSMQVNGLIFEIAPEPFNKDIIHEPAFAIH